jgi:hypothetical protein
LSFRAGEEILILSMRFISSVLFEGRERRRAAAFACEGAALEGSVPFGAGLSISDIVKRKRIRSRAG